MKIEPLDIEGAWLVTPEIKRDVPGPDGQWIRDDRGAFLEWYRADLLEEATGVSLPLAQANHSISRQGVVRGIHFAEVPPGQAKYLYCPVGRMLDVVVDIRVGSPTYGKWTSVEIDDAGRQAVFIREGLGHGFRVLSDEVYLVYLCSAPYNPGREHTVSPIDPAIGVDWGPGELILSPRDTEAPTLAEVAATGVLPTWTS